ncbi:MAG: beta-lactamase family protein [Flammeovirgaceae bacterium]|nr:beta-lactamase family protein [Flammeovirgaceae bacterium]
MKNIAIILLFVFLIGCETRKPNESAMPSQEVAVPVFEAPSSFDKLAETQPIIDKIYKDYADRNHFPSIVYGVVANGKLVYTGSHGYANIESEIEASSKSVYRIASMSKSFTSMAILKLRDEGKLNITDPVSKYVPEFRNAGALTTDAPAITIQDLMTMSAGFPEDNPWGDRQLDDPDEELLEFLKQGLSFSNVPGVTFEYSNLGYALLGRIITNVSGKPYQEYIIESILNPLGMLDSRFEFEEVPAALLARGYLWGRDQWTAEPILNDGAYGAMGGMLCSMEDFAKYVVLHLEAWPPRNDEETGPVRRSSIREMHQPWRFNTIFTDAKDQQGKLCPSAVGYGYGLGWRKDCTGKVRISHSGGLPGYGSEWRIYPEYGIGVVSFSNERYGAPSGANAIVLDTLISLAGLQPRVLPASEFLQQRKEQIVEFLSTFKEDGFLFAENFYLDESLESRRDAIEPLLAEAGEVMRVNPLRSFNQLRGHFIIECENKNVNIFFTLTPEKVPMVQQLDVWLSDK